MKDAKIIDKKDAEIQAKKDAWFFSLITETYFSHKRPEQFVPFWGGRCIA